MLRDYLETHACTETLVCPDLPFSPEAALSVLDAVIGAAPSGETIKLVGSSLGGYYASVLSHRYALKAVLINPAVRPYLLLTDYLGLQRNIYTGEEYVFTAAHIETLRRMEPDTLDSGKLLVLLETGDEILDYREAVERYRGATIHVVEGGHHEFEHFPDFLDEVVAF